MMSAIEVQQFSIEAKNGIEVEEEIDNFLTGSVTNYNENRQSLFKEVKNA